MRFPEFRGEWQEHKLSDVAKYRRGSFPQPYGLAKWYDDEHGSPFIQVFDVGADLKLKETTKRKISQAAQNLSVFVKKGSIVLTIQGSIGRIAKTQYDAYVDRTLLLFNSFTLPVDIDYFISAVYLLFEREKVKAPGGTLKTITKERLNSFPLCLPGIAEQSKVGSFLVTVDEKIELVRTRIDLLKKYKKGVMQAIFSQKLRFKDEGGNSFPDWEEKKLGNIAMITKGAQLNGSELTRTGKYPMINGGIGPSGYTDKFNEEANTITISEGGNSCGFVGYLTERFWSGGHCYTIQPSPDVEKAFLYQQLKFYQLKIMRLRVGSGLPNIQRGSLLKLVVLLPILMEQVAISGFLTALDDKIKLEESKLEQAKRFKKALLQQMFV